MIAAVLVYVVRTRIGDAGHSPLQGITVSGLTPQQYLGAILAIVASLLDGIALGPEVALVATGSVVGTLVSTWLGITDAKSAKKVIDLGALGAILAQFVGPILFIALVLPSDPSVQAALVVGVVPSVIAKAKMKWPLAFALGIVIGFVMGTWTLVPAAVIGAVVARAIPRWGDRAATRLPERVSG